jgi:menaquinone-specific isochorismate synthase
MDERNLTLELENAVEWMAGFAGRGLVSYIIPIPPANLLDVFANAAKLSVRRRAFWSEERGITLVGIDAALEYDAQGDKRFQGTEEWYRKVIRHAVKNRIVYGTGPLILGGFSFSDKVHSAGEWQHFPGAGFFIPRYLFTEKDHHAWLTINMDLRSGFSKDEMLTRLKNDLQILLFSPEKQDTADLKILQKVSEHKEDWLHAAREIIDRIRAGHVDKVVLSRTLNIVLNKALEPARLLKKIYANRTYGFVFAVERDGDCFLGATPERLVKRDGEHLYVDCLAGTDRRGETAAEDEAIGQCLLQDSKNLVEHRFVVESIKETMQVFCETISAPGYPRLVKTESVQHLYTPVRGKMKNTASLFEVIGALHPTPAMGGSPRERALAMIRELEPHERGWYAAPVGWMDGFQYGDFAVGIRSALLSGEKLRLFAGCGIVKDSNPDQEYEETEMKFRPILRALEGVLHV